jgi:hypothetical protein
MAASTVSLSQQSSNIAQAGSAVSLDPTKSSCATNDTRKASAEKVSHKEKNQAQSMQGVDAGRKGPENYQPPTVETYIGSVSSGGYVVKIESRRPSGASSVKELNVPSSTGARLPSSSSQRAVIDGDVGAGGISTFKGYLKTPSGLSSLRRQHSAIGVDGERSNPTGGKHVQFSQEAAGTRNISDPLGSNIDPEANTAPGFFLGQFGSEPAAQSPKSYGHRSFATLNRDLRRSLDLRQTSSFEQAFAAGIAIPTHLFSTPEYSGSPSSTARMAARESYDPNWGCSDASAVPDADTPRAAQTQTGLGDHGPAGVPTPAYDFDRFNEPYSSEEQKPFLDGSYDDAPGPINYSELAYSGEDDPFTVHDNGLLVKHEETSSNFGTASNTVEARETAKDNKENDSIDVRINRGGGCVWY